MIVDFINMKDPEHLKALMDVLREEASKDSVQTTVVDRTSLHLVEMTRKESSQVFGGAGSPAVSVRYFRND